MLPVTYSLLTTIYLPQIKQEILRINLTHVVLQLKAIGFDKISKFDFLDKPKEENLKKAVLDLKQLNALNKQGQLTELGRKISILPLNPIFSYLLIISSEFQCMKLMIDLISIIQIENLFFIPKGIKTNIFKKMCKFRIGNSDHLTKLKIFRTYLGSQSKKKMCQENFLNRKGLKRAKLIRD